MASHRPTLAPRQRWSDVSSELRDVAITTWDVDPAALATHLPPWLAPDRFILEGRERAFVSAVTFLNVDFFVGFAPFVRLTCRQTNYRAYVRRGAERAVWFFATTLGTPWVLVPRSFWCLPWSRSRGEHQAIWEGERLERLRWSVTSARGHEDLACRGTGELPGRLPGFATAEETALVLTHPMVGYLRRRSGDVATYSVWHEPMRTERAEPERARFELYEHLGLVERDRAPHSLLVQRQIQYLVMLPPRRVRSPTPELTASI
jgi:uncharacterized protein YqjF (DUF2071 family)